MNSLPEPLQAIYEAVHRFQATPSDVTRLRPTWNAHLERARQVLPELHVESEGESVYLGELSPGCQACKAGTWDCVFITVHCNLNCRFCCNPHAIPQDYSGSAFGRTPAEIIANYARTTIEGISFSGGEPSIKPARLLDWLQRFKEAYPTNYYWLYTNGLLLDEKILRRLGELGLHEIRFNMAATGYLHPIVIRNLRTAARFIPTLTVEIPAIPSDHARVLTSLAHWCEQGVRFLNLHELMYEPGTNAATMAGERQFVTTSDGHSTIVDPRSRAMILEIMRKVRDEGLPLSVNACSLLSKIRQVRGRRRSLAPLVQAPYEHLTAAGELECYCAYRGDSVHFFHPNDLAMRYEQWREYRIVHLARTAPLSLHDPGQWTTFEFIDTSTSR